MQEYSQRDPIADHAVLQCLAWDPSDCDAEGAREYADSRPEEIAAQHAEWLYGQGGDPQEEYNVRVRITKGGLVQEWAVCVYLETAVTFRAVIRPSPQEDKT